MDIIIPEIPPLKETAINLHRLLHPLRFVQSPLPEKWSPINHPLVAPPPPF